MKQINWNTDIGFPRIWHTKADNMYNKSEDDIELDIYKYGGGRTVYDISHITTQPSVLKIAINKYGKEEISNELQQRHNIKQPFKSRLVPIIHYGNGWCVQPKCEIPNNTRDIARQLQEQFKHFDMKDKSEIYSKNVGLYNNTPVIFDYGGIGFDLS